MKSGLNAETAFQDANDATKADKYLVNRIVSALKDAEVSPTGYHTIQVRKEDGIFTVFMPLPDNRGRSWFNIQVADGNYSIESLPANNLNDDRQTMQRAMTPMTSDQINQVVGETDDHNTFIGALEYILAIHYPEAVENGTLMQAMEPFKKKETSAVSADPHARVLAVYTNE